MKKLLSATLAVAFIFAASGALAQSMFVGAAPTGGSPGPVLETGGFGQTFDLIVSLDTAGEPSSGAEFVMTELLVVAPGVFKLATNRIFGSQLDLGDNAVGEYIIAFGACAPPGIVEMVRVNYGTFQGDVPSDTVIALRGLQPGDSQPSTFGGELGFFDCTDNGFVAQFGGTDGGETGSGVVFPDGSCVVNPTPLAVDNEAGSMGQLKARF
jgi:hypothetical protein